MNFQNDRYTLRFALPEDDGGIRDIFLSEGFSGGISVQYLREPSPLASFEADGDPRIMVVRDNVENRVAAVGGAVLRDEYINDSYCRSAYLTGLKIHPDYRGKLRFMARSYRFLYESIKDCNFFYTTILDDNTAAIALLEKKHKNMPEYRYLGHYTTYCFHGGKNIRKVEKNNLDGFEELYLAHVHQKSLVPADYRFRGFGKMDFYSIRDKDGKIIACCFVCNQQAHKQYKLCSYGGIYSKLSKLPTKLLGYPAFPKEGENINYGMVAFLYVLHNDRRLCSDFLRSVAAQTDFDMLMWGGFENDPLCKALDSMKTIRYGSRLYSVVWDGREEKINGIIGLEAALL